MQGGSLADYLRRSGPLPWDVAVLITQQICAALAYAADSRTVLHLRLSPHKVLFTEEGVVRVTGFRSPNDRMDAAPADSERTLESLTYQAPEQICGKPEPSQKTDLYALGCMLFEMLMGRPPFSAETPLELAQQHLSAEPPRIAGLLMDFPIWLDSLVAQLLEKKPDRRPHFASSVAVALEETMEKVRSGASAAQHALAGGATAIRAAQPDAEAQRLMAPKRKKKRPQGPIYERLWFLLACLGVLIGIVTWAVWPPSEEKLFTEAKALMETNDRDQWDIARRDYLQPLLSRFPDGPYAGQAQEYIYKIEMEEAQDRVRRTKQLGRTPASEGERRYIEARQFEDFGDLATALKHYQEMVDSPPAPERDRAFVLLAKRQITQIRSKSKSPPSPVEFLENKLNEVEQLAADGQLAPANRLLSRLTNLYHGDDELAVLIKAAQKRLTDKGRSDTDP
jgi:hypothetical protein